MSRSKRPTARVSPASDAAHAMKRTMQADLVSMYAASGAENALLLHATAGWNPPANATCIEFRPAQREWEGSSPLMLSARRLDVLEVGSADRMAQLSLIDVPIGSGETLGIVRCIRARGFDAGDVEKVSQAAVWLRALFEAWRSESGLAGAALNLARSESEEALIRQVVLEACKLVHAEPERSGIYLSKEKDEADETVRYVLHRAKHDWIAEEYAPPPNSPTAHVLRSAKLLWSAHIKKSLETQPEWAEVGIAPDSNDHPTHAYIGIPFAVRDQRGALILKAQQPQAWGVFEVRLVERLLATFKAQLDRMRVRESLLFSLFTASARPIVAVDLEGKLLEVNSAAASVVDESKTLRDSLVDKVFYGGDSLLALHVDQALQTSGDQPLRGHFTYLTREGGNHIGIPIPVCLEAKALAVRGGRTVGSVGIFDPLLADPLPSKARSYGDFDEFTFTADPRLLDVLDDADESRDRSLLLLGERGSGKSFLGRHLRTSPNEPFVAIRCGGVSAPDLAAELGFAGDKGRLDEANGGVLFLDELSYVPPMVQRQLLNVLEDGKIGTRSVSIRLIAATRCAAADLHDGSRFLPELLNHLDAGSALELPPFRERRSDVLLCAVGFLKYARRPDAGFWPTGFESEAVEVLWRYRWPGGVRELFELLATACNRWCSDNEGSAPKELRRTLIGSDHFWKHLVQDALHDPFPPSKLPSLDPAEIHTRLERRAQRRAHRALPNADSSQQEVPSVVRSLLRSNPHLVTVARTEGHGPVAALVQKATGRTEHWAATVVGRELPSGRGSDRPPSGNGPRTRAPRR